MIMQRTEMSVERPMQSRNTDESDTVPLVRPGGVLMPLVGLRRCENEART